MSDLVASSIYLDHFADKRVVITGAARGIGLGIGKAFAQAGASVILVDRSEDVNEAAEALREEGLDAYGAVADVTNEQQMRAVFAQADELWGTLDVLINNAGIITISNLDDLSIEDFQRVLNVNTTAVFLGCREAAPLLRRGGGGVILNAASGQAREGFIYTPHYAASKFGVVGLSQSLAKELAADNVRVNSYCPGIVKTEMWSYNDAEWGKRLGNYAPGELMAEWISQIPLKRAAETADVANLLLFLASDAATYITGQAINIDGGMAMN